MGATYSITITNDALLYHNSSPRFKAWPPVYVCGDRPIAFDHSATDQEGDSIVYSLCVPYSGADTANSKPTTPSRPPFPLVVYKAPYSIFNLLNGNPALTINRSTGILTGQPNGIGQYLVGYVLVNFEMDGFYHRSEEIFNIMYEFVQPIQFQILMLIKMFYVMMIELYDLQIEV